MKNIAEPRVPNTPYNHVYNVYSVLAAIRTTIIRDHASHMRLPKRGLREKKCLEK